MSSTETPPRAVAPIAGLLERQIEAAVRAYGRRAPMLAGMQSLLALRAVDQRFDALVDTARYYGADALKAADHALGSASRCDRAGAVFVASTLAFALPSAAPQRRDRLIRYIEADSVATQWACHLYGDGALCRLLLAEEDPALRRLGIILSGALGQDQYAPAIEQFQADARLDEECLLSLVKMGRTPKQLAARARADLLRGTVSWRMLQAIGMSGVAGVDQEVEQYAARLLQDHSAASEVAGRPQRDTAIAIWAARRPLNALAAVGARRELAGDTGLRAVALAGRIEGLLPLLRELSVQEAAYSPAQLDVLRVVFGPLPPDLTIQPGTVDGRARALRTLACEVFRQNGCAAVTPERLAGWDDALPTDELWPLEQIRLRGGHPLRLTNALAPAVGVSHRMRTWLYLERASMTARPFPLAADDHALRQLAALQMIQDLDELQDHQ